MTPRLERGRAHALLAPVTPLADGYRIGESTRANLRTAVRLPRAVYQRGAALDLLIQGAALDVLGDLYATEHSRLERLAHFIEAYFCEGRTIVDIATNVLGLRDRAHVSNHYRNDAFDLIACRFLILVESADPLVVTVGLQEAFTRREQRWERATQRVSAALDRLVMTRYDSTSHARNAVS